MYFGVGFLTREGLNMRNSHFTHGSFLVLLLPGAMCLNNLTSLDCLWGGNLGNNVD